MQTSTGIISLFITAALLNNFVLHQFLGLCPFIGSTHNYKHALRLALASALVLFASTVLCWTMQVYVLEPFGLMSLRLMVFVLIVGGWVSLASVLTRRFSPLSYRALGIYLPLIASNCAILGAVILSLNHARTFGDMIALSSGGAAGLMLASVLLARLRVRLDHTDIPGFWRGKPIALLSAGVLALGFMGFASPGF